MLTTLTLTLALAGAPAGLPAAPVVEEPAAVQCADATLSTALAPIDVALGDIGAQSVTCKEDCNELPDIQCTGNTCSAVSRDCSVGQRGYVQCDSNPKKFCSEPCPVCTDGDFRSVRTGQCCDCSFGGELRHFQECIDGQWVTQNTICGPSSFCPRCP